MRLFFSVLLATIVLGGSAMAATPAAQQTPEAQWKQEIADANIAYAGKPDAILKIQDAAYLGEGESASLTGTTGKPDSFKWMQGKADKAFVAAHYAKGALQLSVNGKQIAKPLDHIIAVNGNISIKAQATQVGAGVMGVRIFVYNQQRKAAKQFTGLDYFAYDPSWIVTATFTPDMKFPASVFRTSRGTDKQFYRVGTAHFTLKGKKIDLPFYSGDNKANTITDMSAFFADSQAGNGTYGAGRYIDVTDFGKFPPKTITLNFNEAYNPNCARSDFYTCPVARDVIDVAIKAGERDPHAHH